MEGEKTCRQHAWARKLLMLQSLSSSVKTWFAAVQQRQCFLSLAERVVLWNLVVDSLGACSSNKIRTQKKTKTQKPPQKPNTQISKKPLPESIAVIKVQMLGMKYLTAPPKRGGTCPPKAFA